MDSDEIEREKFIVQSIVATDVIARMLTSKYIGHFFSFLFFGRVRKWGHVSLSRLWRILPTARLIFSEDFSAASKDPEIAIRGMQLQILMKTFQKLKKKTGKSSFFFFILFLSRNSRTKEKMSHFRRTFTTWFSPNGNEICPSKLPKILTLTRVFYRSSTNTSS